MQRLWFVVGCVVLAIAGCASNGSDDDPSANGASSTTGSSSASSTTTAAPRTTTSPVSTTTVQPCASVPIPKTPVTNAASAGDMLLTDVTETSERCVDHVTFDFRSLGQKAVGYEITYGAAPFTQPGSGTNVAVAGSAFVVVRMSPAYGFDILAGTPTYTGPTRITPPGANHVRELVQLGDFEGVITWVIGLDEQRPFTVDATGAPSPSLTVDIA